MSRIPALQLESLPADQRAAVLDAEKLLGFVPNDALIMARNPALAAAFSELVATVYAPGEVASGLKRLIGLITSSAAGCQYCVAHTAFTSGRHGVSQEKLGAVWTFETSDQFTAAEKAALRVALHSGQSPNAVSDEMFAELGKHFSEEAQLEIVAVISMFGFLNRWNSTLRTDLESLPRAAIADI